MQWGKTESAAAGRIDIKYPRFNTGTSAALGMPTAPATAFVLLKTINFENGNNNDPISTTVPSSTGGQSTYDLVQSNSQINKLSSDSVVNGNFALACEQLAGSTNQINNYLNLGSIYSWIGITTMVRFSKITAGTFTFIRLFSDTTYTTTLVNTAFTTAGKLFFQENGQTGGTSTGTLAANTWYCCQIQVKAGTNNLVATFYARGTNTVVATVTQTLVGSASVGSLRKGIGSTIDTGNTRVSFDDFQVGSNGFPDRTDIGNIPPVTNTLSSSKTLAMAGGTVTFTADASDADGTVADAIWTISADNGVTAPTMNIISALQMQIFCRAATVDHTYTVTYTPIDDQGLAGETTSITLSVLKSSEQICTGPGPTMSGLVIYQAI